MTIKAFIGIAVGGLALAFGMIACSGGGAPTTVDVIVTQEVTVEVTRVVPTTVIDEIHVEVPVTRELEVTREVYVTQEVPVEVIREVEVTREVYVTQEVPVEVIREVEVTVEVGEVTRVIEQTVEVTREIEVTREVEVGEVTRVVEVAVPVQEIVEVIREVHVIPEPTVVTAYGTNCADEGGVNAVRERRINLYNEIIKYKIDVGKPAKDQSPALARLYRDWARATYCLTRYPDHEQDPMELACEATYALAVKYIYNELEVEQVSGQPARIAGFLERMRALIRAITNDGQCVEIVRDFKNWTAPTDTP